MARLQCTVCRSLRLPASRRAPSLTRSVKGPWVHSGSGNEPAARPSSRPCSANWPRVSHAPPLDAPFGLAFHQSHPEMAAERAGDRRKVRRDGAGETRAGWRMGEPSRCCQKMAFIEALTRRHRELNNVAFGFSRYRGTGDGGGLQTAPASSAPCVDGMARAIWLWQGARWWIRFCVSSPRPRPTLSSTRLGVVRHSGGREGCGRRAARSAPTCQSPDRSPPRLLDGLASGAPVSDARVPAHLR